MVSAIDRELKRGTLEMILLKLLAEREMYGYQLVSTLEARSEQGFQIKEGTLYPVLYRLEDAGLIEARWETPERGTPRKYYRLTRVGLERLQTLIGEWQAFVTIVNRLIETQEVTE
jgi:PadR family transcriptional regulator PadR